MVCCVCCHFCWSATVPATCSVLTGDKHASGFVGNLVPSGRGTVVPSHMSTLQREDIPSSYSASDNVKYFHAVSRFDHVKNFEARSVFHQGDYKRGGAGAWLAKRPSSSEWAALPVPVAVNGACGAWGVWGGGGSHSVCADDVHTGALLGLLVCTGSCGMVVLRWGA